MEIQIEKVNNGYVCRYYEEDVANKMVFEDDESETGELDCMVKLLYFVKEYFGIYNSKHNKHNIIIEVEEKICKS